MLQAIEQSTNFFRRMSEARYGVLCSRDEVFILKEVTYVVRMQHKLCYEIERSRLRIGGWGEQKGRTKLNPENMESGKYVYTLPVYVLNAIALVAMAVVLLRAHTELEVARPKKNAVV